MSELSRNQLVTRRNFIQRAADAAKVAGLGAALGTLGRRAPAASGTANPWAYDDSLYRRTDPKLVRYHEVGRFRSTRPSPRCLAMSKDQRLFIGAGKYLTEYGLDGAQLSEIALAAEPRCVSVADDNAIYIGLRDHLEVYSRRGEQRGVWETRGEKAYFTGVAVSQTDVFVADAGSRVVLRYDRSGKLKGCIGEKKSGSDQTGFIVPSPFFDVQLGHDGLLRVTNPGRHRVETYTCDGDLEYAWGSPGAAIENFCGCCNPIHLALLEGGRIVTFEKGIPRVKVLAEDGKLESVVAGAESFVENSKVCGPNDCTLGGLSGAADAKGRIYALDLVTADVRVMEHNKEGS